MSLTIESPQYRSRMLEAIRERADAPFGMLFLGIPVSHGADEPDKAVTTQTNDETSNDGTSKLDPLYDEDDKDEEIPETY